MLSATRPRTELNALTALAIFAGMLMALAIVAHLAPTVTIRSTALLPTLGWTGGWATAAVAVALLSWAVARKTGVGVRDGYGIAPRWSISPRRLVQIDYGLEAAIVGALALSVYLAVRAVILATTPTDQGPLLVVLFTQVTTAALAELVLLGVLAALARTRWLNSWDFVLASAVGRAVIVEGAWPAALAAAAGGALVAVLYLHTRRLTPIIVGHTTAITGVTLIGVWVSSLS